MSVFEYETKDKPAAILKFDAGAGTGTALFSRYFIEDADGDYTKPGFLPNGAVVPMLIAHTWSEVPIGKGKIRSTDTAAYYDFTLADTARGRELGEWLRFDFGDGQPKSEFSYGFKILPGGSSREMINGKMLRVLHAREDGSHGGDVREVSYVLAGSGVSTALVTMKAEEQYRYRRMHEKILRQIAETKAQEQSELQALFEQFMAREREMQRC